MTRAASILLAAALSGCAASTDPHLRAFYANWLPPEAHSTKAADPRVHAGPGLGPDRVFVVKGGRTVATLPAPERSGATFVYLHDH